MNIGSIISDGVTISDKKYFNSHDLVASGLFVSTNAVRIAVCQGRISALKVGNRNLFTQQDIDQFLRQAKRSKTRLEMEIAAETYLAKKGVFYV